MILFFSATKQNSFKIFYFLYENNTDMLIKLYKY